MYLRQIDNKTLIREFDSIGEMVSFLDTSPDNKKYWGASKYSSKSFTHTSSYEEAMKLLLNGWTEAANKMTRTLKTLPQPAPAKRQKSVYSVAGHTASVPRYLQGIPTNMIASVPDRRKQPVVVINHAITYSAYWEADDILKEGIKALQVVQAIEASNRNVKLNIVCIAEYRNYKRGFKVCIKQPGERLNISKMAFPLAHPSMLRRMFLKYMEVEPEMPVTFDSYGRPCNQDCPKFYPNEMYIPETVDVEKIFSQIS